MVTQELRRNLPDDEAGSMSRATAIVGARQLAGTLERLERSKGSTVDQARRRVAAKVRVGFGTFENIVRDRVKRVDEAIRERLFALLVREMEAEIARLSHELEMVRRGGSRLDSESVREIETHLAAIKSLMKGRDRRT